MYVKILQFITKCFASEYSLLDAATILLSFMDNSKKITRGLSSPLKKEYSDIRKQIAKLSKSKKEELYNQIKQLSEDYIAVAAIKDSEQTYDAIVTNKIGTLASMTTDSLYGGGLFLLSCITPHNDNFKEFIDYLNSQMKKSKDKQTLKKLISLLTDIRQGFQKDNNIAQYIIETVKTASDVWAIRSQYQ